MTVGSWNRDSFTSAPSGAVGDYVGVKWFRSWSGSDKAASPKAAYEWYTTYRDDLVGISGKRRDGTIRFRRVVLGSANDRVPKRAYRGEHPYTMTEQRMPQQLISWKAPAGSPGGAGGSASNGYPLGVVDQWGFGQPDWLYETLLTSNDQIKLVGKLKDLLDGSDFNLGVMMGELGDTLGLIGGTAKNLGLALGYVRRGLVIEAAGALLQGTRIPKRKHVNVPNPAKKVVADKWLELQYGWLPLLHDVKAAAEMLAHYLNVPLRKSYRVSVRREATRRSTGQLGPNVGNLYSNLAVKEHRRGIIARISEKGSIPQMLGLANPELIAWELLPYSFVADWFIPLGSWMEARALVDRLTGTFITSDKRTGTRLAPTSPYFIGKISSVWESVSFTRSVSTTLKVPMPTFKPLGSVTSWQHCANAVGLLVSGHAGKRD